MKKSAKITAYMMAFVLATTAYTGIAYAEPEETTSEAVETVTETEATGETERQLSSDNSLASIEIAQGELVPAFQPEQLIYTMTVSNEVDRITLRTQTTVASAKKTIQGTGDLKVGENTVVIQVTAEDGSVRIYQIVVTREAAEGESIQESQTETSEEESNPESESAQEASQESGQEGESNLEGSSDPVSETEETPQTAVKESETTDSTETEESLDEAGQFIVSAGGEEESFLDRYHQPIMIGAIAILVLLCIIITVLLLKRKDHEKEETDEEMDDEEEENTEEVTDKENEEDSKETDEEAKDDVSEWEDDFEWIEENEETPEAEEDFELEENPEAEEDPEVEGNSEAEEDSEADGGEDDDFDILNV
jgi:hypothetical protein